MQALKEGRSIRGKLEVDDWKKVTHEFHHKWPQDLLPKEHPLERHFGIAATPPNSLKGPAVWGYTAAYQKVTQDFCFFHRPPDRRLCPWGTSNKLLLAIFFHWRMFGRLTMLFPVVLSVEPYLFRSPQDTAEAKQIPALHWDVLEDLEG